MSIDYADIVSQVVSTGAVSAIVALGVIKLAPNFTMWAVDKVAGVFGYDPYDRNNKHGN